MMRLICANCLHYQDAGVQYWYLFHFTNGICSINDYIICLIICHYIIYFEIALETSNKLLTM
jgi:hypothetical protein